MEWARISGNRKFHREKVGNGVVLGQMVAHKERGIIRVRENRCTLILIMVYQSDHIGTIILKEAVVTVGESTLTGLLNLNKIFGELIMVKINNNESNDRNDWRFRYQDEYLMGVKLIYHEYKMPRPSWDHDHCDFCWATFSEYKDDLHEGYSTENDGYWICEKCYRDFLHMFNWTVENKK